VSYVLSGYLDVTYCRLCRPKRDLRRSTSTVHRAWAYWFKQLEYYQVAAVYALTRLVCNVSQAILPFFIVRDLNMHQSAKAVVRYQLTLLFIVPGI